MKNTHSNADRSHRLNSIPTAARKERRSIKNVLTTTLVCFLSLSLQAQQTGKKSFAFRGKVGSVDAATKRLTVTNEPIEGWMGAMTMGYRVDKDEVFSRVKAGDQITATVYEGDFTLYNVQVVPQATAPAMANMPGMQMPNQSTGQTHPQGLQEPETGRRTGTQTPVPELLTEAAKRPPMTLKDFQDLAAANNPSLKQASDIARRSAGQARQAGLYPNPVAGFEGGEIRGGAYGRGEVGPFVQQTIVLGGKLRLRRRVFEEQRRQDELGVSEQRYRLTGDVEQSFYSTLAAQEIVNVRRNLLRLALDTVETAHQLGNVGQADSPDILQAEVEGEQAKVEYETAQRNFIQEFQALAALVGKPALPLAPIKGDLEEYPKIDAGTIIETIVRDSPSVKRAQQGVAQTEAQLHSARREAVPDLQIRAGIQQNRQLLQPEVSNTYRVGAQGFVTAGVNIPIFNRNQGNVEAAKAELDRARNEVARVELSIRQTAQPFVQNYLRAQLEAQRYKNEMLPRAGRAYELYRAKYGQMAAAYPQVIVSQRTLFQLQVNYVQVLESLWTNASALRNFTLSGGLSVPTPAGSSSTTINLPNGGGGSVE
ncbi:MAG TPA: TolC family protein [Terriglobales bacterium]|nr:TolC family protein [Terriglobales bacterium]